MIIWDVLYHFFRSPEDREINLIFVIVQSCNDIAFVFMKTRSTRALLIQCEIYVICVGIRFWSKSILMYINIFIYKFCYISEKYKFCNLSTLRRKITFQSIESIFVDMRHPIALELQRIQQIQMRKDLSGNLFYMVMSETQTVQILQTWKSHINIKKIP